MIRMDTSANERAESIWEWDLRLEDIIVDALQDKIKIEETRLENAAEEDEEESSLHKINLKKFVI